jgi:leucine-zipper of insertion element IS481
MKLHGNARLSPKGRLLLCRRVLDDGWSLAAAAEAARPVELVDQGLESLLCVAVVDGVIERLPVGLADALALGFGQLDQQVAHG